ncbi:MAG TPA: hypothetical protein VN843_21155 [Anaerolineales bacterium]|nr:hypothetical protein [Anaerolineales bacterium]
MKSLFLVLALVSLSLVSKVNAAPCNVSPYGPLATYEDARAVFIGEVLRVEPLTSEVKDYLTIMRYRVTFKVEYSWKGAGFQEIGLPELAVISEQIVSAPPFIANCTSFVSFYEGKKYLVYASETPDKKLTVWFGNGSKPLWEAEENLKGLKQRDAFYPLFKQ